MRIMILTQNENLYIPTGLAKICNLVEENIVCIVSASPMSTHGGAVKGIFRHVVLFGFKASIIFGCKIIYNKILSLFSVIGDQTTFFSLKQVADAFSIPYYKIKDINSNQFYLLIDNYTPDLLVSLSCPQIVGKKARERFTLGCINVHGSPLPRYRGLMPAFWVLRNAESVTAVTVHELDSKLDDGDILLQQEVLITSDDSWDSLVKKLKLAGALALVNVIRDIKNNTTRKSPNLESEATYYSFPSSKDRKIFLLTGRKFFNSLY
uniref:Methionyl-tRNA formyltransferase n=1 Tax=uncultured verrucomicrobium HF0500_08N17 TaxID=723597 RepID=E7C4Y1_9BACT|nr:methionyl-tRNA formyltransferase [uncultured verrucomicrobium HF0500_08N17]